jgi:[CysO sulfur-carrier protein]-S-L-cysteine hydrolase
VQDQSGDTTADICGPFPDRLELDNSHWQMMLAHIRAHLPEESCGLIGGRREGRTARAAAVILVPNELRSPVRFRMDPARQLEAFYWLEKQQMELLAIFHSHPAGPPVPSATDLEEFAYPGSLTLICSPLGGNGAWQMRGFCIAEGRAVEVPIDITDIIDSLDPHLDRD